jgi:hypothetical protein
MTVIPVFPPIVCPEPAVHVASDERAWIVVTDVDNRLLVLSNNVFVM